jgi:hypothetical protein
MTRVAKGDKGVPRTGLEMLDMERAWIEGLKAVENSRQDAIRPCRGQTRILILKSPHD